MYIHVHLYVHMLANYSLLPSFQQIPNLYGTFNSTTNSINFNNQSVLFTNARDALNSFANAGITTINYTGMFGEQRYVSVCMDMMCVCVHVMCACYVCMLCVHVMCACYVCM